MLREVPKGYPLRRDKQVGGPAANGSALLPDVPTAAEYGIERGSTHRDGLGCSRPAVPLCGTDKALRRIAHGIA